MSLKIGQNNDKTHKKAALVRFLDQSGLDYYLSQTSKGPKVCPFLFKTVARRHKKVAGDHCGISREKQY